MEEDWLLKWCILEDFRSKRCESVFSEYDKSNEGFLSGDKLLNAIESISKLNNLKLNYLFSVLNMCDVDPLKNGADAKLFSLILALASRIKHLDDNWFSNMLPQFDLYTIENKVFKIKNLWNYLADQYTKTIYINDIIIEFEAGGVTSGHVNYAREKFSGKTHFDLLDYLTYIPLFVHIHDRIISNPLSIKQEI